MLKKTIEIPPSLMNRVINCPWSHRYDEVKEYDDEKDYDNLLYGNDETKRGILAHRYAAACLTGDNDKRDFISKNKRFSVGSRKLTDNYVQYIRDLVKETNGKLLVEHDLKDHLLDFLYPGCFGRADAIIDADDDLYIIDLKFGNSDVAALNNWQLLAYAIGAETESKRQNPKGHNNIHIIIYKAFKVRAFEWNLTSGEARDIAFWMQEQVKDALNGKTTICAGVWCDDCVNKTDCRAWYRWLFGEEFAGTPEMIDADWEEVSEWFTNHIKAKTLKSIRKKIKSKIKENVIKDKEIDVSTWYEATKRYERTIVQYLKSKGIDEKEYTETKVLTPAQMRKKFADDPEIEKIIKETALLKKKETIRNK